MFVSFVHERYARQWADAWLTDLDLTCSPVAEPSSPDAVLWVGLVVGRGELRKLCRLIRRYRCGVVCNLGTDAGQRGYATWRFEVENGTRRYASRETILRQL